MARIAHDAERRNWLRGAPSTSPPMRPPWARDEAAFLDACTRCNDCVDACPEAILVRADGGYPQLRRGVGECTFCGDCARACTPRALDPEQVPRAFAWVASIGAGCLTGAGIVCQACRDACPPAAIRFAPARVPAPQLDPARCNACGACLPACPAQAITLYPAPQP